MRQAHPSNFFLLYNVNCCVNNIPPIDAVDTFNFIANNFVVVIYTSATCVAVVKLIKR